MSGAWSGTRSRGAVASGHHARRRAHRRRAALIATLTAALLGLAAPAASAAPWQCDAFGYLFQASQIQQIDLATGRDQRIGSVSPNHALNGVGYNMLDDYFYAWNGTVGTMVRVNSDRTLTTVPSGAFPGSNIGDFDDAGRYFALQGGMIWELDYAPGSPTYGQVLRTVPMGAAPPRVFNGVDWSWVGGYLYMIGNDADGRAHLVRIDPATGVRVDLTPAGFGADVTGVGATYADARGYVYGSDNATGDIYRIDPVTTDWILLARGPRASSNDGARCATAPIPTVTVTKTVAGRVDASDQFTVGLADAGGAVLASASTAGTGTSAATGDWPVSQNATYTITDAASAGSATPVGQYAATVRCTDAAGTPIATGGTTGAWTLTIASATYYTCAVTNSAAADLALAKSASSPAVPGALLTYTLRVLNDGPSPARSTRISDPLPAGLSFVSASPGCAVASGTVTCDVGDLPPGGSATVTVTARVADDLPAGILTNTATAASSTPDPDPSDNTATSTVPVAPIPPVTVPTGPEADLSIEKIPSVERVAVGSQLFYTLILRNDGPSDATGVVVSDTAGAGLELLSARGSQGRCTVTTARATCRLGTIAAGGTAQVLVSATAAAAGRLTNGATVSGDQPDPDPADNAAASTVVGEPPAPPAAPPGSPPPAAPPADLAIVKTSDRRAALGTQAIRYTLTVRNLGPGAAAGVQVIDTPSLPVRIASVRSSTGSCTRAVPIRCRLGTLRSGARATVTVVATPRAPGLLRNSASVTGDVPDPSAGNNLDGVATPVRGLLRVRKTASARQVRAGGTVSYAIAVTNASAFALRSVRVCDDLPGGLVFVASAPKSSLSAGRRCWTVRTLGAGRRATFTLRARALPGAGGRKVNVATATAPGARGARTRAATGSAPVQVIAERVRSGGVTG